MQAWARPCDTKRLKHQLVEGKVYALSNFEVGKGLQQWFSD
jgi:hypothetical protein